MAFSLTVAPASSDFKVAAAKVSVEPSAWVIVAPTEGLILTPPLVPQGNVTVCELNKLMLLAPNGTKASATTEVFIWLEPETIETIAESGSTEDVKADPENMLVDVSDPPVEVRS